MILIQLVNKNKYNIVRQQQCLHCFNLFSMKVNKVVHDTILLSEVGLRQIILQNKLYHKIRYKFLLEKNWGNMILWKYK